MKLKPLFNNVLIEATENDEKTTKSGIVLPDNAEKKEQSRGVVLAVGPGKFENGALVPMSVKIGDNVLFSKPWSDDKKFEENGKKSYLVEEGDILAILE